MSTARKTGLAAHVASNEGTRQDQLKTGSAKVLRFNMKRKQGKSNSPCTRWMLSESALWCRHVAGQGVYYWRLIRLRGIVRKRKEKDVVLVSCSSRHLLIKGINYLANICNLSEFFFFYLLFGYNNGPRRKPTNSEIFIISSNEWKDNIESEFSLDLN